jgi:hypothetical protein
LDPAGVGLAGLRHWAGRSLPCKKTVIVVDVSVLVPERVDDAEDGHQARSAASSQRATAHSVVVVRGTVYGCVMAEVIISGWR